MCCRAAPARRRPVRPRSKRDSLPPFRRSRSTKVCGSGLKAVMLASQAIKAGDAQVIVAGGRESMSNAPYYAYGMRGGVKAGDQTLVDGMIKDGLWCASCNVHMGRPRRVHGEESERQPREIRTFRARLHIARPSPPSSQAEFKNEIAPVQIPGKKGRPRSTPTNRRVATPALEASRNCKPAFPGKNGDNDDLIRDRGQRARI